MGDFVSLDLIGSISASPGHRLVLAYDRVLLPELFPGEADLASGDVSAIYLIGHIADSATVTNQDPTPTSYTPGEFSGTLAYEIIGDAPDESYCGSVDATVSYTVASGATHTFEMRGTFGGVLKRGPEPG